MPKTAKGSCLCKQVSFEITGFFDNFFLCHCKYCQKDTGSAHAANLFSKEAEIKWLSGKKNVRTFNLPSTRHVKSFCLNCGSALPTKQKKEGLLIVPAGSLDSEFSIIPDAHIFLSSKAKWETGLNDILKINKLPK